MARRLTNAEKQRFRGYFPSLDVNAVVVTAAASRVYNCLSWTVGVTNRWLWPGGSLADFDTFYRGFGLTRSGDGPIAAWGHSVTNMTHGSISGLGHGPRWESKCGADLRIQHGLNELAGSSYGRIIAFYRRSRLLAATHRLEFTEVMNAKTPKSYLTAQQQKALKAQRAEVPAELREKYERAFRAWRDAWFRGGLMVNSNPHSRAIGREFDDLIALGPSILPLVIESLAEPENFFALQLYDALQSDEKLLIQFAPDDERLVEGEQGRALRVVQTWFANH